MGISRREFLAGGMAAVGSLPAIGSPVKSMLGGSEIGLMAHDPFVNPYVVPGLVAMWDGEFNTARGVHNPGARTWEDLVGINDLILPETGYFEGNRYVSTSTAAAYSLQENRLCENSSFTVEGTFILTEMLKRSTSLSILHNQSGASTDQTASGFNFYPMYNNNGVLQSRVSFGNGGWGYTGLSSSDALSVGTPVTVSISVDFQNRRQGGRTYHNGILTRADNISATTGLEYIVPCSVSTGNAPCVIFNIRVYDRVLSAEEVAYNHAIDQWRFLAA